MHRTREEKLAWADGYRQGLKLALEAVVLQEPHAITNCLEAFLKEMNQGVDAFVEDPEKAVWVAGAYD